MKYLASILCLSLLLSSPPAQTADRTAKGAAIGAGVGLIAGDGVKGMAQGAVMGGGIGALSKDSADSRKTKDYAKAPPSARAWAC